MCDSAFHTFPWGSPQPSLASCALSPTQTPRTFSPHNRRLVVAEGGEDVTIKVSDEGGGIPRSGMSSIWTYLYSTAKQPVEMETVGGSRRGWEWWGWGWPEGLMRGWREAWGQAVGGHGYGEGCMRRLPGVGVQAKQLQRGFPE